MTDYTLASFVYNIAINLSTVWIK